MITLGPDLEAILREAEAADLRYGQFASTHEALGVLTEEYYELMGAIWQNDLKAVRKEALQLASVALRCAAACTQQSFIERSRK
jgi:NTP pyrophosphatase (non-canonical NTP hydrolase)